MYILVTPAKNEGENLAMNINSIANQTLKPAVWVIVDDGSTDNTQQIIEAAKKNHVWIKSICLNESPRDLGIHVANVVQTGFDLAKDYCEEHFIEYDFIVFLDADMLVDANKNFSSFMGKEIYSPPADKLLEEGDEISLGRLNLIVIHTPGHTPGGISLVLNNIVFTGDTLFAGGIGRTDLPGGSYQDLIESIKEKLLILGDDKIIYPGHGPDSTIGEERRTNSYIKN